MKKGDKQIISKIINLFKSYKWRMIPVTICIIASSTLSILTPLVNQQLMYEGLIAKHS